MADELREKVARALAAAQGHDPDERFTSPMGIQRKAWERFLKHADAAIALIRDEVLEEAAKVVDNFDFKYDETWAELPDIASALRAMKGQKP